MFLCVAPPLIRTSMPIAQTNPYDKYQIKTTKKSLVLLFCAGMPTYIVRCLQVVQYNLSIKILSFLVLELPSASGMWKKLWAQPARACVDGLAGFFGSN